MLSGLLFKSIATAALLSAPDVAAEGTWIDPLAQAEQHPIVLDRPGPDFFDGALLGNGGLGAVVTTRPDAVAIHFGHNNVWDIRIAEDNKDKIGTFKEIFEKVKNIPGTLTSLAQDPWYADYLDMTQENYRKPYPRPFPCGTLLLGFDRRRVELLGYRLDIATAMCTVNLLEDGKPLQLRLFVDTARDALWFELLDASGQPAPNCFERIRIIPDPDTPADLPRYAVPEPMSEGGLSFRQELPYCEPVDGKPGQAHPRDRAFKLTVHVNTGLGKREYIDPNGEMASMGRLEATFASNDPLVGIVVLQEGLGEAVPLQPDVDVEATSDALVHAREGMQANWKEYWSRSGITVDDDALEQTWYWNQYFMHCAAKAGVNCPGLFANWSYRNIGTAWHGDYHMNYNTQQPFWMPFSSNRVEENLPYVELVERLLPLSRKWASDYYGLRGAYFPHSAYPVDMTMLPYPVPTWGWEICETPWTVQGLWWHYLYTMDEEYLRERAFGPIREAVQFLADYMKRPEAHGPAWGDDRYHIFPTVPPELYGLKPGFKYNHDCLVDLTLTKFAMKAYLEAVRTLELEEQEKELVSDVRDILDHFPVYPKADSHYGTVFVSVPGENPEMVYNVPNSLTTVFPGEEHGLGSDSETLAMLADTYRSQQNEGGNELVFLNLQAARAGVLDVDRFARQIRYCLLPNGTCADMVLQTHGRYGDTTSFDYMSRMGIWFENFGLPMVLNECLMQSYDGVLRLFPNWPLERPASFRTLRAAGAFLVSASCAGGRVSEIEVVSEKGKTLRIQLPWSDGARVLSSEGVRDIDGKVMELPTVPGETFRLLPR